VRLVNRLVAFVLGAAIAAAAILFVIEAVAYRLGAAPVLVDWRGAAKWAQHTTWSAPPVRLTFAILAGAGLVLLLAQLTPGRPGRLPVVADDPSTDAAITRRGVANAVRDGVTEIDGVVGASVAVNRRRIRVLAQSVITEPNVDVRGLVAQAAQNRLDGLRLRHRPGVSVRIATRQP
jgi:hypothetical protein